MDLLTLLIIIIIAYLVYTGQFPNIMPLLFFIVLVILLLRLTGTHLLN